MRTNKELLKAMVMFKDTFSLEIVDVIDYENNWWLVYKWLDIPSEKVSTPERIVKLSSFPHHAIENGNPADFHITQPLTKSIFLDPIENIPKGVVAIDNPKIKVPLQIE